MKLVVTAEEHKVLTDKVLKHSRPVRIETGGAPIRLASLPAALLGRLCGFEELRVEIEKTQS